MTGLLNSNMNYLTMCSPSFRENALENTVPTPGTTRIENNIYSIPLFHNEFYENVDTAVRTSCDITQACRHHICRINEPLPCDNIRYTTETWRRNLRDRTGNTADRDSGNDSLHMNIDDIHQPQPATDQINHDRMDDTLGPKKSNKQRRSPLWKIFIYVFTGIVFGIIVSSVVWLTVDKFKHSKFNCTVQSSLMISNLNNLTDIEDFDKNKKDNLSEETASTFAEIYSTSQATHTSIESTKTLNALSHATTSPLTSASKSVDDSFDTSTLSIRSSYSTAVHTTGRGLSPTDSMATQSIPTSPQSTSTMHSKDSSTSRLPLISLTSDFTQEPNSSSPSDISEGHYTPNAEGLLQTTTDTTIESGGQVYYRWGRIDCPEYSELVYEGFAAGGHYIHSGGAANNLCLPSKPTWGNFNDAIEPDRNLIHVTEYESTNSAFNTLMGKPLHDLNVPCAVCQATGRNSFLMIPGRTECLHGWYQEYTGYLMGGSFEHPHGKSLICVDSNAQSVPGTEANENGNLLYFVEFRGTNTHHYINGRELPCVVCTR